MEGDKEQIEKLNGFSDEIGGGREEWGTEWGRGGVVWGLGEEKKRPL